MGHSAIPAVIDALVERATAALPDINVYDGFGIPGDLDEDALMIGVDAPSSPGSANSAGSSQTMAVLGTDRARDQTGSVTCAALSWNGDADQKAARDAAYAVVAAVEDLLRTDPTLGVAAPGRSVCQMGSETLTQSQYEGGTDALIIFTVDFAVRL